MQTEELRQSFSSHARSNQVNGNCKLCLIESLQKAFVFVCTALSAQIEELRQDRVTHVGSTQEGGNSQLGGSVGVLFSKEPLFDINARSADWSAEVKSPNSFCVHPISW